MILAFKFFIGLILCAIILIFIDCFYQFVENNGSFAPAQEPGLRTVSVKGV